jgi:hypothetical protein
VGGIYSGKTIQVFPQDLQDFAWSAPMRDLAGKVGLSDVGLKKLLRSHGVVTPPQGYWNKVHAGRPVPKRPEAPPRQPGETGRVSLDERFATVLPAAESLPSAGPFASAAVPEDLGDLHAQEVRAIGKVAVSRKLDRVHHGLTEILAQDERRRMKAAGVPWHWDAPKFDSPLDRRRLRILNAIFMTLAKRGHRADAYERDGEIHARATIGDTYLGLSLEPAGKRPGRGYGRDRTAVGLPATTPLQFSIDPDFDRRAMTTWSDDAAGTLESRIVDIVARIIVAGEAKFRRGLREAEQRAEEYRRWQEKQRQERIEARNRERLQHLRRSGELLRQAEDLRALIMRVREAVVAGSVAADRDRLEAWESWASAEADRLDPILSGQIQTHVAPPEPDE